jgi:hypothetical protein
MGISNEFLSGRATGKYGEPGAVDTPWFLREHGSVSVTAFLVGFPASYAGEVETENEDRNHSKNSVFRRKTFLST